MVDFVIHWDKVEFQLIGFVSLSRLCFESLESIGDWSIARKQLHDTCIEFLILLAADDNRFWFLDFNNNAISLKLVKYKQKIPIPEVYSQSNKFNVALYVKFCQYLIQLDKIDETLS